MSMQQIFDTREQRQHHHCEHSSDQDRFPGADTAGNPESGGEPDRGGSGQPADVLPDIVDDHTGAKKPNTGDDALNDADDGIRVHRVTGVESCAAPGESEQRRTEGDQGDRAQPGRLAAQFPIQAHQSADQRGRTEP